MKEVEKSPSSLATDRRRRRSVRIGPEISWASLSLDLDTIGCCWVKSAGKRTSFTECQHDPEIQSSLKTAFRIINEHLFKSPGIKCHRCLATSFGYENDLLWSKRRWPGMNWPMPSGKSNDWISEDPFPGPNPSMATGLHQNWHSDCGSSVARQCLGTQPIQWWMQSSTDFPQAWMNWSYHKSLVKLGGTPIFVTFVLLNWNLCLPKSKLFQKPIAWHSIGILKTPSCWYVVDEFENPVMEWWICSLYPDQ